MMNFRILAVAAVVGATLAGCVDTTSGGYAVDSYDRNVTIANQTGRTVYRFYGSNVGTSSWEEDILGSNVLGPYSSVNINFNDGTGHCNFDFKIEFADGGTYTDYDINVCQITTYTIR